MVNRIVTTFLGIYRVVHNKLLSVIPSFHSQSISTIFQQRISTPSYLLGWKNTRNAKYLKDCMRVSTCKAFRWCRSGKVDKISALLNPSISSKLSRPVLEPKGWEEPG